MTAPMIENFVSAAWGATELGKGPPDFHHAKMSIWLITRGPPFAMRFARYHPSDTTTEDYDFYHRHDTVDSIHVITGGSGFYLVDGVEHRVAAGTVLHHLRGVPHCGPFPDPGGLDQIVIQVPNTGHTSDFIVCPDSGLRGAYRDRAAFDAKYGDRDYSTFGKLVLGGATKSEKWLEWHKTP